MTRPISILRVVCLAATMAGCRSTADQVPDPEPVVHGARIVFARGSRQVGNLAIAPVSSGGATDARLFGRLTWDDDATARVFSPFAGRVRRVLVDIGQHVARGTPLAEIDSPDFGQAQADARTARSEMRLADSNCARLHELFAHGAAAQKDVDAAEAEVTRAASGAAQAEARLAACGGRADSVTGQFVLRAPIAGTIVDRALTPGEDIRPDQMLANAPQYFAPLFVVSDPSHLWIQIEATEAELGTLRPGESIAFTTAAFPGRSFAARIAVVSESIDPGTHTVHVRATCSNDDHALKAEMFVTVSVSAAARLGASVPSQAVFLKDGRHYVFVQSAPDTFERREVSVASQRGVDVLVSGGVRAGDLVVTQGSVLLEQLLD